MGEENGKGEAPSERPPLSLIALASALIAWLGPVLAFVLLPEPEPRDGPPDLGAIAVPLIILVAPSFVGLVLGIVGLFHARPPRRRGRWLAVIGLVGGVLACCCLGSLVGTLVGAVASGLAEAALGFLLMLLAGGHG